MKKIQVIKIGLLFFWCVVLFLCSIPWCVSGIRTYYGLRDAEVIDGSNLSALREGEIVKVVYDCAFACFLTRPTGQNGTEHFQRLKLFGSDECLLICLDDTTNHELQNSGRFFYRTADAVGFTPERRYMFAGKVEKMENGDREALQTTMLGGMFADPDGVDTTQMEYYIHYINMETAKGTMLKNYVVTAGWAMGCFFTLRIFARRLRRMRYGGLQQQETQEEDTRETE